MNTPQEIAASLVEAVAGDIYNQTEFAHLGEMDKTTVTDCVAQLPLAELIAVAMAANGFATTESNSEMMRFELAIQSAIEALRATGKIEL